MLLRNNKLNMFAPKKETTVFFCSISGWAGFTNFTLKGDRLCQEYELCNFFYLWGWVMSDLMYCD